MANKEQITSYYVNAREQIKLNNPLLARKYVLMILNAACKTYYSPDVGIKMKVKTAAFMDKWLAVSRDLYGYGVTEYVAECFGLADMTKKADPLPAGGRAPEERSADKNVSAEGEDALLPDIEGLLPEPTPEISAQTPSGSGGIDISKVIEDAGAHSDWGSEVFESNKSAVVEISVVGAARIFNGTGFIISDKGYVLTNDHVVFDESNGVYHKKLKMSLAGEKKMHKLEVIISDKKSDVALCTFDAGEVENFSSVKCVKDYSKVKQGAECLVIGNAFGMGLAPCIGYIRFAKNDNGNLVYTVPTNPGDSGGPVFNRAGECIGINKSKTVAVNNVAADGYANATPMDTVMQLLEKWTKLNQITL